MPNGETLLTFVTFQRGSELAIARRNTQALRSRGGYEVGAGHYPVIVALHASWLVTLWLFGRSRPLVPEFVTAYFILQAARFWVRRTLGARWTTRIIILQDVPRVAGGPYRFLKHPNYAIVALELPCASLAVGLPWHALVFGSLNLAMLAWRVRVENAGWQDTFGNATVEFSPP